MHMTTMVICGSSLLAQGTAIAREDDSHFCRFIPARAGNGILDMCSSGGFRVHPCSRRERKPALADFFFAGGSSLLAQGTVENEQFYLFQVRFIPARAGNGHKTAGPAFQPSVHPCSRRERTFRRIKTNWEAGSSLLAQGTDLT